MPRKKQSRMNEMAELGNVLEWPKDMRGRWHEHFGNKNPIVLELAAGKGEYAIELAKRFPDKNFIAVDKKGARMWVGAKKALEEKLGNVAFLRIMIEKLTQHFAKGEVDEIWITFPDPFLKKPNRRLAAPRFLDMYHAVLKPGGVVHMKTDSDELYEFTLVLLKQEKCEIHEAIEDVYAGDTADEAVRIRTFYEQSHLEKGRTIHYVRFSIPKKTSGRKVRNSKPG